MTHHIIKSNADIKTGVRALRKACTKILAVHDVTGDPPLRRMKAGFPGLAKIIVGQQLSIASANAIWGRAEKIICPMSADKVLSLSDRDLRQCGLSAGKIRTLRALSAELETGALALEKLGTQECAEIHQALTNISGIGPWTADIFIMFCLGRADSWAPGDLALKHAVRAMTGQKDLPKPDKMIKIAERWRPWRAVAARLLWAYYAHIKSGQNVDPV